MNNMVKSVLYVLFSVIFLLLPLSFSSPLKISVYEYVIGNLTTNGNQTKLENLTGYGYFEITNNASTKIIGLAIEFTNTSSILTITCNVTYNYTRNGDILRVIFPSIGPGEVIRCNYTYNQSVISLPISISKKYPKKVMVGREFTVNITLQNLISENISNISVEEFMLELTKNDINYTHFTLLNDTISNSTGNIIQSNSTYFKWLLNLTEGGSAYVSFDVKTPTAEEFTNAGFEWSEETWGITVVFGKAKIALQLPNTTFSGINVSRVYGYVEAVKIGVAKNRTDVDVWKYNASVENPSKIIITGNLTSFSSDAGESAKGNITPLNTPITVNTVLKNNKTELSSTITYEGIIVAWAEFRPEYELPKENYEVSYAKEVRDLSVYQNITVVNSYFVIAGKVVKVVNESQNLFNVTIVVINNGTAPTPPNILIFEVLPAGATLNISSISAISSTDGDISDSLTVSNKTGSGYFAGKIVWVFNITKSIKPGETITITYLVQTPDITTIKDLYILGVDPRRTKPTLRTRLYTIYSFEIPIDVEEGDDTAGWLISSLILMLASGIIIIRNHEGEI